MLIAMPQVNTVEDDGTEALLDEAEENLRHLRMKLGYHSPNGASDERKPPQNR